MLNHFYTEWDTALLTPPKPEEKGTADYRTPFQIHRDRLIHTSAFRRLQGKTQVFLAGEYDFYRTRLTHSIEVSQIGRSICCFLQHSSPHLRSDFFIDSDLVEAACLAHDLGHPPFGHAGERSLHQLMVPWGGFEGNAQTLRLLTETIFGHGTQGLNPSRAFLDATLKYKTLFSEIPGAPNHFIYDEQQRYLEFVNDGQAWPHLAPPGEQRDALKSIECQIMDWADDTAYSLHDIADGINAGFLTIERIERWAEKRDLDDDESQIIAKLIEAIRKDFVDSRLNKRVGDFIRAVSLEPHSGFLSERSARHAFRLVIAPEAKKESKLLKKLAFEVVFKSPQLQQLDFKARRMLGGLWDALSSHYLESEKPLLRLLSESFEPTVLKAPPGPQRARLLCDFLARLTDKAASQLYQRLHDANYGSIVDLM